MRYVDEKLSMGVRTLAASLGSLQDRLLSAFVGELHLVRADDLPEHLRGRWEGIEARMTSSPAVGSEGLFQATASKMTDEDALDLATQIVDVAFEVRFLNG